MSKPKRNTVQKKITMHPSVKDAVVEFAKTESLRAEKNKTTNIAVITEKTRDFRLYVLENEATGNNQNFIHISRLNEVYGINWNDYVKLSTRFKMPNIDKIVSEIVLNISKNQQNNLNPKTEIK